MVAFLTQLNYSIFQLLNSSAGHSSWFDAIMIFSAQWLIFCWPLLLVIAWGKPLTWRRAPLPSSDRVRLQDRRAAILWLALACLIAYAFNLLIEQFVFEPRPFISHHVHLLVQHVADSSFPSDHTAWSFAVVGMLALSVLSGPLFSNGNQQPGGAKENRYGVLLSVIALFVACLIGVARIIVGLHYPDDILGGALDGLLAAVLVTMLRRLLQRPTDTVLHLAQRYRLA